MKKVIIIFLIITSTLLVGCRNKEDKDKINLDELTEEELKAYNEFQVIKSLLSQEIPSEITNDLNLKQQINGYRIKWESSNEEILPLSGKINRSFEDKEITLSANLRDFDFNDTFIKKVVVKEKAYKNMEDKKLTFAYLYDHRVTRKEDYEKIDIINYSFGLIRNGKLSLHERPQIKDFVRETHNYGVKVVLAIGGWSAGGFSEAAMTQETRKILIDSIVEAVKEYDLDGIDYDWEYPTTGVAGIGSDPKDRVNFTSLIKETREALDKYKEGLILSSAFSGGTWGINTYYQIRELNKYLDYFHLMNYDGEIQGKASHHTSALSVSQSVKGYINAGVTPNKIVVGGAFYGKRAEVDNKDNPIGQDAIWKSTILFSNLKRDFLDKYPENVFYDESANAPYYYDGKTFISYDNEKSLKAKTDIVHENDLAGIMFWSLTGDNTGTLLDAIYININR